MRPLTALVLVVTLTVAGVRAAGAQVPPTLTGDTPREALRMRNSGVALTIVGLAGAVLLAVGIIGAVNDRCRSDSFGCLFHGLHWIAIATTGATMVPGLIAGIPLWVIGQKRVRRLAETTGLVGVTPLGSPGGGGAAVTYTLRF